MATAADKQFREDFGYPCWYTPTICDGPVFRWGERCEVSASRNGVMIHGGTHVMQEHSVDRFVLLVRLAESIHRQLKKNDRPDGLWFGDQFIGWGNFI